MKLLQLIPQLMKSRTMIVNIATLVVTVATAVTNVEFIAENPETVALLGSLIASANMILRVLTTKSVFDKETTLSSD